MPFKDPEERKAWRRKWRKKRFADEKRLAAEHERLLLYYQKNLEARRKVNQKANRAAGFKPRKKGPKATAEIVVSTSKRFRFLNGKIYFTSKRGFEIKELREILRLVTH